MENTEKLIELIMLSSDSHDKAALRAAHHVGGVVVGFNADDVSELKRQWEGPLLLPELRSFQSQGGHAFRRHPVFLSLRLTMHLLEQQTRLDNLLGHWVLKDDMIVKQEQMIRSQELEIHRMGRETRYHRMRLNLLLSVPGVKDVPGVAELIEKWGMVEENIPEDIA